MTLPIYYIYFDYTNLKSIITIKRVWKLFGRDFVEKMRNILEKNIISNQNSFKSRSVV